MTWPVHRPEFWSMPMPGSLTWAPGRGDYGADHSTDLVYLVEELNCSRGCAHSGTRAERREHGPGGICTVIMRLLAGSPGVQVPELDPREDGPRCRAHEPLPVPVRREKQRGTEPLFPIPPQET